MIVNAAYPYMQKMKKQPVIFSGNTINYKFNIQYGCKFVSNGLEFSAQGRIDFLEIDATKYTQITFTGINTYHTQTLDVQVINSAGAISSIVEVPLSSSQSVGIYNIPEAYRTENITLRLTTDILRPIIVTSAVLS